VAENCEHSTKPSGYTKSR